MDNEFFKGIAAFLALIVAFFATITVISYNDNESVTKMVQAGAHPLDARCAVGGGTKEVCAIRSVKHD